MKHILIASLLSFLAFTTHAQEDTTSNDEYELKAKERYGYIITSDDKRISGIVKLVGTARTPWVNQKKVRFIDSASIDPTKKRQKFQKLKTDDLNEYVAYQDDGSERHFRLIKYTNTREGLQSGSGLGGSIKMVKNFARTSHMAEVIVDGKITVYRLYGYPTTIAAGGNDVAQAQQDEQHLIDNPTLLYQKEDGKIKEMNSSDVKELVEDCKIVSDKLAGGQYKSYDPSKEEKKKSGLGKMIKHESEMVQGSHMFDICVELFPDYNMNCK